MAEPALRRLLGPDSLPAVVGPAELPEAYAWPAEPWVRANMITTLDGAVADADGRSGGLGNPADRAVFAVLRETCQAIVVGAGTARVEEYGPPPPGVRLVVVSRGADLPAALVRCPDVTLATGAVGADLAYARESLGPERVWACAGGEVRPAELRARLVAAGHRRILHEGGPRLLARWLRDGAVDELCLTVVPRLLGGRPPLLPDPAGDRRLRPVTLLEEAGTLLGRWVILRSD